MTKTSMEKAYGIFNCNCEHCYGRQQIIAKALEKERSEGYREGRIEQAEKMRDLFEEFKGLTGHCLIRDKEYYGNLTKEYEEWFDQMNKDIDKPNR